LLMELICLITSFLRTKTNENNLTNLNTDAIFDLNLRSSSNAMLVSSVSKLKTMNSRGFIDEE
jgi:hypothetical protein